MRRRLLAALKMFALTLLAACSPLTAKMTSPEPVAQPRTDADGSLQVGDVTRFYDLYVPSSHTGEQPMPLLLVFHGAGGDGRTMEQHTGFSRLAEQEKFIVVYPDAIGKHWDARRGSQPETNNDIGFIKALLEQLGQQYKLDRSRIYAAGFSNGGMFAQRIACELSDKIAAGATVAATMPENLSRICQPVQPVSMLLMHGTDDPAIPYGPPSKALLSLADTVKYWSTHNRCSAQPAKTVLPQAPYVRLETYEQCANETTVMFYTIEGGKHAWPRPQAETPNASSQEMDASAIIWDFFSKHAAPDKG
jgi:polyhydroxybutyrate depolymerase